MLKNVTEAYTHVNGLYVFNPENYPVLGKLSENASLVFALKHSFLHMYKNIEPIAYVERTSSGCRLAEGYLFDRTRDPETPIGLDFRTAVVKMITNYLKLGETLGLSNEEFSSIQAQKCEWTLSLHGAILGMMKDLARECEKADHAGFLSDEAHQNLIKSLQESWAMILHLFAKENVPVPYEWIPEYMKSR